jgi:hypothetical protein
MSPRQLPVSSAVTSVDAVAGLRVAQYTESDWELLYRQLASGERVTVHLTVWCRLFEEEPIRSASRAGIILETGGMLVRLSPAGVMPAWLQALPISPNVAGEPGHAHSVMPVTLSDGWEVIRCIRCGAEW